MNKKIDFLFLILILLVFIVFLIDSQSLIAGSKRMPVMIIIPGIILTGGYLLYLFIGERLKDNGDVQNENSSVSFIRILKNKHLAFFSWLMLFTVLIYLLGFMIAIPLFLLFMSRLFYKEGWIHSIALAGGTLLFFQIFFIKILQIAPYEGVIFRLI
ncbi:tripartite tricarboxylate transporter TctB family protein [Bacillus sp. Marseille-P3661]|uniref:tripartite tricarboxylate transporter TctB family protein n=1 Tax=Bacillus sp. Marseille-P3661 TaxID=1936234 RepID=UPI000C85EBD8|nr:tripartite tricarboxylate transporter TctB family protein [Bacillus sp. Marseille-P3661]